MIQIPAFDPVEYLTRRRFPEYASVRSYQRFVKLGYPPTPNEPSRSLENRASQMKAYVSDLRKKSKEELTALCAAEQEKERQEFMDEVAREESARFFNQPHASADFLHWSKAAHWTLDEAIALSFGKAPEVVKWNELKPLVDISPFARQYSRVRDLAHRAVAWEQLYDPVLPGIFLAWARQTDIEVPAELIHLVESRGIVIANWKDMYEKCSASLKEIAADRDVFVGMCQRLIAERDDLRKQLISLKESSWEGFDQEVATYPSELDIAMQAWRAVTNKLDPKKPAKKQVVEWLETTYPKLSAEAKNRISIICNWEKEGGRRKHS